MDKELYGYLSGFMTERRKALFEKLIKYRTRYITVALEDIFQPQNASAVLRTCDCFGIQDIHIIENSNQYNINPDVALGSNQWLNLYNYNTQKNNTPKAIATLKKRGYRIVATTPHTNDVELENFDIAKGKFALFFGTELRGLSKDMLSQADEFLKIPMYGFTESFNISVSAAIIIHHLTNKLRKSGLDWQLNEKEQSQIKLSWTKETVKDSTRIIENYKEKHKDLGPQ